MNRFLKQLIYASSLVVSCQGTSYAQDIERTVQESFFLRRVVEFWKDRDFASVKAQIEEHLASHPSCEISDPLQAMLGDLYFEEGNFTKSITLYTQIRDPSTKLQTLYRHVRSLQETKRYGELIALATPFTTEKDKFSTLEYHDDIAFIAALAHLNRLSQSDVAFEITQSAEQIKLWVNSIKQPDLLEAAQYSLAEAHRVLGEYQEACTIFEQLAENNPSQKTDLLLASAQLRAHFDISKAIALYESLLTDSKEKSEEIAYNLFSLLFRENRFGEMVKKRSLIESHLSPGQVDTFHFILGESYIQIGEWGEAAALLGIYVQKGGAYVQQGWVKLGYCASALHDEALLNQAIHHLLTSFPAAPEISDLLLIRSESYLEQKQWALAASDLENILQRPLETTNHELVLYNYGIALLHLNRWELSHSTFSKLLEVFPNTALATTIYESKARCSVHILELSKEDLKEKQREILAFDLQNALQNPSPLISAERDRYEFLLGKTFFDMKQYPQSIAALEHTIATYPQTQNLADAHLLLGMAYRLSETSIQKFIEHGELALLLNSSLLTKTELHFELFNAYLVLDLLDSAADHLYAALEVGDLPILIENQIWLAHFYAGKEETRERAIFCFKQLLKTDDSFQDLEIREDNLYLEEEALEFSKLLPCPQKITLFTSVLTRAKNHPELPWKFQRKITYELGCSYEELKQPDLALGCYEELIQAACPSESYYSSAALLAKTRLNYARLSSDQKQEQSPALVNILNQLKDLQIQKKVASEPIHLEAALEYADIRMQLSSPDQMTDTALFFLGRLKEDFSPEASREYHENIGAYPKEKNLFDLYMQCVEAETLLWQAKKLEPSEAHLLKEQSSTLFLGIIQHPLATPYLKARAERLMHTPR